jgi:AraC-like DNA-binding protein
MALIECKEPVFDRQVNKVLALLDEGKEKEDIAEELGYSNPASLDNYMRRRNFAWESRERKFVPAAEKYSGKARNNLLQLKGVSKAALIISLFTEDGANPKDIAEQTGFTSHNEMATFMKRKKYEWDVRKNNYTKIKKDEVENNSNVKQLNLESEALEEVLIEMLQGINELKSGKKKAVKNGATDEEADELPRYKIEGNYKSKAFNMNSTLENMIIDFSKNRRISQKDIFEIAVVDFLLKYGEAEAVEDLFD